MRVLLVEANIFHQRRIRAALEGLGDEVVAAESRGEALAIEPRGFDALLVADELPDAKGVDLVRELAADAEAPPAILLLDPGRVGESSSAFAAGAADVVVRTAEEREPMRLALVRAMERKRLTRTIAELERRIDETTRLDSVSGLYTPRTFTELLEREIERITRFGGTMALLRIGMPRAEGIERTLGPHVRDTLTREIGAILRRDLRLLDLAGVWPDGHVVVALNGADRAGAERVVERLDARLSELERAIGVGEDLMPRPEILAAGPADEVRGTPLD